MEGSYPNPAFTRLTYQLSSLVWRSCYEGRRLSVGDTEELVRYRAGFAEASGDFPRYPLA